MEMHLKNKIRLNHVSLRAKIIGAQTLDIWVKGLKVGIRDMDEESVYGSTVCMKDGGSEIKDQDWDVKLAVRAIYTLVIGSKV